MPNFVLLTREPRVPGTLELRKSEGFHDCTHRASAPNDYV